MATTLGSIEVEGLADLLGLPHDELIESLQQGLPGKLAEELRVKLELTQEQLAALLRLTPRTLQRRMEDGRLGLTESERLWELARLFFRAADILESEAGAVQWMKSPIQAFGWKTPLSLAHTAVGLREIENILGRIEHGVFS